MYRNLWEHSKTDMPKKDRNKSGQLDPLEISPELQTAGWLRHSGRFRKEERTIQAIVVTATSRRGAPHFMHSAGCDSLKP